MALLVMLGWRLLAVSTTKHVWQLLHHFSVHQPEAGRRIFVLCAGMFREEDERVRLHDPHGREGGRDRTA
jgi:hypothetical protein